MLLERRSAEALTGARLHHLHASATNGRGPRAWDGHWLLLALRDSAGGLQGILWVDDPRDRLRPGRERLQLLRTFANQASSALEATQHTERLRHLAEHDPLTGLRNRRGLRQRVDALIQASEDRVVGLIVFDIDAFKRINDRLGHEVGDRVLRTVAATLESECAPGGLAVRLGGEDFALLLPGADSREVMLTAERVKSSISDKLTMVPWPVTLSVGVAVADDKIGDAATLLRAGTRALFAAKRLGRDRIVLHSAEELEALLGTLEDLGNGEQLAAMVLLVETLDLRDPRTARHSQTVGRHAERLATALGWSPDRVERIRIAGVLHDIGKLGLSDAILHKPGRLDATEWAEIERHPEMGARILDHANLRDVAAWVLCHHERVDGTGYPRRLTGDEIPLEARILSVADAFEAMTADRSYRLALPPERAVEELLRERGRQFDADVVDAFQRVMASNESALTRD
ncbi:MAG: diguanylate cyclase [Solirubrobacterales bacterium]|nr:diguanylate cyclase [Solirubrobacterales bacterium]